MIHSMTGFGQAAAENDRFRVTVTLRAVNHRFLDLAFRLRDELRAHEAELRALLTEHLHRGRVEVGVELTPLVPRSVSVSVDTVVAEELHRAGEALAERGLVRGGLAMADLLRMPEVMRLEMRDAEWRDVDVTLLLAVTRQAALRLRSAREAEGRQLWEALARRIRSLEGLADDLRQLAVTQPEHQAELLRARLADLLAAADEGRVDEARLAQEVAVLADRSDVSEELDRLASHLHQMSQLLGLAPGRSEAEVAATPLAVQESTGEGPEEGTGKRLDFLVQELVRELNTIGSKCRDAEMTRQVVEGKVLCEQIREQVQNVE